jgi:hypothetical protein
VSGDGRLDLVASGSYADVAGVIDTGALYLWHAASLGGASPVLTKMTVPGAKASDHLGF